MRVVGGAKKGRRLAAFKGRSIRPTSDRVREAIFDILPGEFPFRTALDVFAGTGAMGIEALSRGADSAVFVEIDSTAAGIIRKNLSECGLDSAARIMRRDALGAIRLLSKRGERFDLIFIDPPYESGLAERAIEAIDRAGLLASGGYLVAETSRRSPISLEPANLEAVGERRYGDTLVYFFAPKEDHA